VTDANAEKSLVIHAERMLNVDAVTAKELALVNAAPADRTSTELLEAPLRRVSLPTPLIR